jgi:phosphonate transport system substrate-binding protein
MKSFSRQARLNHNRSLLPVSKLLVASLIFLQLVACNSSEPEIYSPSFSESTRRETPIYRFGIHPLHNPKRLHTVFAPMINYLSNNIDNATFMLEASRNYASYDKKLYSRKFHFSLPNPYQTINSLEHGYRVFGKMADDDNFRGIILVRKDSGIQHPVQLKGKIVSFPAPTALAATMMPQYYLQTHGLDVMKDIEIRYVGSQESSIMNVFLGDVAAGATWLPPWRVLSKQRPELKRELEIRWQTDSLPNNGLVVRGDVPEEITRQVSQLLINLHQHEEGKQILARMELSRFESANDATYQPVKDFVKVFQETVRPIK